MRFVRRLQLVVLNSSHSDSFFHRLHFLWFRRPRGICSHFSSFLVCSQLGLPGNSPVEGARRLRDRTCPSSFPVVPHLAQSLRLGPVSSQPSRYSSWISPDIFIKNLWYLKKVITLTGFHLVPRPILGRSGGTCLLEVTAPWVRSIEPFVMMKWSRTKQPLVQIWKRLWFVAAALKVWTSRIRSAAESQSHSGQKQAVKWKQPQQLDG